MLAILFHPHIELKRAKKEKTMHKTMRMLLYSSLIIAAQPLLWSMSLSGYSLLSSFALFVLSYLFVLFSALLLQVFFYIFTDNGSYYFALTSITNGAFVFSLGLSVITLVSFLGVFGQFFSLFSIIINSLLLAFILILTVAITVKSTEFLFATDLLQVLFVYFTMCIIITIAMYFGLFHLILSWQPIQLPFLENSDFSGIVKPD